MDSIFSPLPACAEPTLKSRKHPAAGSCGFPTQGPAGRESASVSPSDQPQGHPRGSAAGGLEQTDASLQLR